MISLLKILSEIKMVGKITPEMIINLIENINQNIIKNQFQYKIDEELGSIFVKYVGEQLFLNNEGLDFKGKELIKNISSKFSEQFYKDLLKFQQKHKL